MIEKLVIAYFSLSLIGCMIKWMKNVYDTPFVRFLDLCISELPIFQMSQDEHFHEVVSFDRPIRISLLYIPLGIYKIYIFTFYDHGNNLGLLGNFKIVKVLSLIEDINEPEKTNMEKRLQVDLVKSWYKARDENIEKHIDFLKSRCQYYTETRNTATIKATFYITIIAALFSVYIGKIDNFDATGVQMNANTVIKMFIFLYLFNIVILLLTFIGVRGYALMKYSTFRDEYNDKTKGLYDHWYMTFRRLQKYSWCDVNFILNTENFIRLAFFWYIVLLISNFLWR